MNLHLDQKEASYSGTSAHGGEYKGPLVEREMQRIALGIKSLAQSSVNEMNSKASKKSKGFWGTLFG